MTTPNNVSTASADERERFIAQFAGHTPGPWEVEEVRNDEYFSHCVIDAQGRSLFDTINADYRVTTIHVEYDEDSAKQWDEPGRLNLTLAAAAPAMLDMLRADAAELAKLRAEIAEQDRVIAELQRDKDRLDTVQAEYWKLDPFDMPTGAGDADVGWRVVQYHEGRTPERMVAEVYRDDLRAAIDAAALPRNEGAGESGGKESCNVRP